ncbi:MAG: hypothetical protein L0Z68_04380 [Gammaproteobacteria bacterium]|nr:hypothetical protein [Gammaproteobacteria bacterium]
MREDLGNHGRIFNGGDDLRERIMSGIGSGNWYRWDKQERGGRLPPTRAAGRVS